MEARDDSLSRIALGKACRAAVDYGIDLRELDYLLGLTPLERLLRHDQALQLILAARKAGVQHYGFDPRPAEEPERA
jgi:hypothetical protein